jgi:hypothetical protein
LFISLSSIVVFLAVAIIEHALQQEIHDVSDLQGLRTASPLLRLVVCSVIIVVFRNSPFFWVFW